MSAPSISAMTMMSPHRSVLEANPDTDESKTRLVEELQSRGRAAVGAKSWMDAKLLYEKCLTITDCSAVDNKKKAIFNSNLSLVENNMGEMEKARVAAEAATQEDAKYVKGWWRLGQALTALHRPQEALEAFSKAKVLDPTNKALKKLVEQTKKLVEEEAALMMEVDDDDVDDDDDNASNTKKSPTSIPAPPSKPTKTTTTTTVKSSSGSSSNSSSSKANNAVDNDDDSKLFTKSEPVRGYKVVNGKKTSYFHNELDEKSRALIGDIAPKKIENPTPANSASAAKQGATTSVWNTGGTWEEKDVSKWAKKSLTELILQTTYTLPPSSPAPGAVVTVEKVSTLDGHASVAVVRGKMRFIYEFCCKLDWQLDKEDDDLNCKGSLAIPDIDGTIAIGEGYEIHDFSIESVSNNSVKPIVDRFVHRGGFQEALNEKIDDWVRLFKKEYGAKDA